MRGFLGARVVGTAMAGGGWDSRRSSWRVRIRGRRVLAMAASALLVMVASAWVFTRYGSAAYRRGYTMVEVRDGVAGYYSNPGYTNFVWLDRGREQGLLFSGPAQVPPRPYALYRSSRRLTEVYVKFWHVTALFGTISAIAWWWAKGRDIPGRCFRCGYDLAGLVADAEGCVSCPECGAVDDDRRAGSR